MTNYVEEMMKTAGAEKYLVTTTDYTKNPMNIHIEKLNDPIFTTEKQLEIIKLIENLEPLFRCTELLVRMMDFTGLFQFLMEVNIFVVKTKTSIKP